MPARSTSARSTHLRSVSGEQPIFPATDFTAAHLESCSPCCSRTIRTEPLQKLIEQRRGITRDALPQYYPRARLVRSGTKRPMQGATAESIVIESGTYKRELWLAEHPAIPRGLFAMMYASDAPTPPLAPMMREVDEALLNVRGFPLADRAEVPVAKNTLIVDRAVTSIAQRDVPQAVVSIPSGYRDVTPKAQ